jgi:hypothetical protein
MADSKKDAPVEAATAGPGEKRSAARPALAKASESGDPAVQSLIADIYTAEQNGDDDQAAAARKALAELGFE